MKHAKTTEASEPFIREILLCDTILKGECDSVVVLPLPRAVNDGEQVYFEALFLSLDTEVVLGAEIVNSKSSGLLSSFSDGLFICQVLKYVEHNKEDFAVVSIHSNQMISYHSETNSRRAEAVFAFRYWIDRIIK